MIGSKESRERGFDDDDDDDGRGRKHRCSIHHVVDEIDRNL